jgi:hypothetical protein
MPFSFTLNETDFERIAQAWQSDHHYCGPKWASGYIHLHFMHLHWDSSESPQPDINVRWQLHPTTQWVVGYFDFLDNQVANNFYRKRFRRGRHMRMSAMDTIEEFQSALNRKGLDPQRVRMVVDTYERLLNCLNMVPERAEIHDIIGYDS